MRCHFCGWDNPEGKDHCEKCNKPLATDTAATAADEVTDDKEQEETPPQERPTQRLVQQPFNPKATVREPVPGDVEQEAEGEKCPECGYTLEDGACPCCGYTGAAEDGILQVEQEEKEEEEMSILHRSSAAESEARKTVRPMRKSEEEEEGTFMLTPMSEKTGQPEGDTLQFEGNEVALNRDNTDPKNPTITSRTQAVIRKADGRWTIEDGSEYKTTFVQAGEPVELRPGALILLGNQLYRFEG